MATLNLPKHEDAPIGDQVERFLEQTASELGQEEVRAAFNRERWFSILCDSEKLPKFVLSLSLCQRSSQELLREWLSLRLKNTEQDEQAKVAQDILIEELKAGATGAMPISYHYRLARLLSAEFSYPTDGTPVALFTANLQQFRRDAAMYAACHRIAMSCYMGIVALPEGVTEAPDTLLRPPYGASIEPCWWLERTERAEGFPFYLWDVKQKKTSIVKEIMETSGSEPEYIAISHTWGRWRKTDQPWISFAGVPWKIPQNERFDVVRLPELLEKFPCDYIWLDLLCIPQEDSTPEMYERQQAEIARQAAVFRSASSAIAWFNNVDGWSSLAAVLRYLAFYFLKRDYENVMDKEALSVILRDASDSADFMIELFDPPKGDNRNPNRRQPNPWFTSLWTLQEVCLRPDMHLCDANWDFLAVTEDSPIALNDLVALALAYSAQLDQTLPLPFGVQELTRLVQITGLQNLLHLSQLSIVTLGNKRHCQERRAEAIMSAIGATDWFPPQENHDLVLDLYPLPFVEELRQKLGSAAFFSSIPIEWEFHYVLHKFCSEKRTQKHKFEELGSLLPFGPGAHTLAFETESYLDMVEHPTLKGWTVEPSGCVRVNKVGIVSSSDLSLMGGTSSDEQLRCTLVAPSAERDENRLIIQQGVDLHEWTKSYKPWSANHAVCVMYSRFATNGILLKEMEPGVLLKIGTYMQLEAPTYEMPATQEVDWLVM